MLKVETPSNIDEIIIQSKDKSDYKKRIESVNELGKWRCHKSQKRLLELMKYDKVYSVKQSAFLKLQRFGEDVKLPKKKKGHLIKDINKKLLKVYNSFQADQYSIVDFKLKFKEKYPEAYDVYTYEKGNKFDIWIQSVIKHSPMKRLKNQYKIEIYFKHYDNEYEIYNGEMSYKGATSNLDSISITNRKILIVAERSSIINPKDILENDSSTIYTQVIKSLLFYYLFKGEYIEIESINITREKNTILQQFTLPNGDTSLNQVLTSSFLLDSTINFDSETLENIFKNDEKSIALYNSISYILKANASREASEKFEKLWKAFNSIYRYFGNGKSENDCQRILRTFLLNNHNQFSLSKEKVTNFNNDTLRERIRLRDLILNDYETKNLTVTFLSFIYRYTDYRISKILRETLVYREDFIKDIMSIDNVQSKFSKLSNVTFLYNSCNGSASPHCIYDKVAEYLDNNYNNQVVSDIEVVAFICIKYAYYMRNKIFHAEKHDLSFRFIENKLTEELDWINSILETLILELIKSNNSWTQGE
jgi:hypothetical protein